MFEDLAVLELTLSVFLGFISALVVEYIVDELREDKRLRESLQGLVSELIDVASAAKNLDLDEYYINPLETPFWDSLVNGDGSNAKLKKDVRDAILSSYKHIENVNNWENMRSEAFYHTGNTNTALDERILRNREELQILLKRTIGVMMEFVGTREEKIPLP